MAKTEPKIKENNMLDTETSRLQQENASLKESLNAQKKQIDLLQQQLEMLIKLQTSGKKADEEEDTKPVCVVSRSFGTACLYDPATKREIDFIVGKEVWVDIEDLKLFLKSQNNIRLFENNILYFEDESNYKRFRIKKQNDISEERILRLIATTDMNEMVRELNVMTQDKRCWEVSHTIIYTIALMLLRQPTPLNGWSYESRKTIEEYFGIKFDELASMVRTVKMLKNK